MNKKVAIIGAGFTGLMAGYKLTQAGSEVTIFERGKEVGGLAGGFKIGGNNLEKAYHHIFRTDTHIVKLIKELGLAEKLIWHESSIGVYSLGKMYPFLTPMDLLGFRPLGLVDKIRMGLVGLWLQKDKDWEKYIETPAYLFMKKWCGVKAYQVIWEPLLKGKFHDSYKDVSMAWLWARIHTRGMSKDSDGKERLGYVEGGFKLLADELLKRIKEKGGIIKLEAEVDLAKVEKDFDQVLYTGAAKTVQYLGYVGVVFSSSQSLSNYYWHNINDPNSPFLCFIQHTNLVDKKNYGNKYVYYLGKYIPHDHRYFEEEEKKITDEFMDYLINIFPEFNQTEVKEKYLFRFKNAQHLVTTNYPRIIPPHKLSEKIYQSNFAQVFPDDRGINFAIREGEKIAEMMTRKKNEKEK